MDHVLDAIRSQFPFIEHYKYLFLLISTSIEGFNSIIFAGFLASIGSVAIIPAVLICVGGDFINGLLWYLVGYFGGSGAVQAWSKKDKKGKGVLGVVERYFVQYSGRAIIFTKLTWSLTIATLVMAGSFRYNFRKFALYNLIGGAGWVAITFTVGYVFGRSYRAVNLVNNIGYGALFLAGAVVLLYVFKIVFRSKFIQSLKTMEHFREIGERLRDGIDKMLS